MLDLSAVSENLDHAGDALIEREGEGFDTVRTALDGFVLAANFEGLVLEGGADIQGSGNATDNVLIGNAGANTLFGFEGDDTLAGWRGNDMLLGGAGSDIYAFSRGDGIDTIVDLRGSNRLHFSGDITRHDLGYARQGSDLVITVAGGDAVNGGTVILRDWGASAERVSWVSFCGSDSFVLNESLLNRAPIAAERNVRLHQK